MSGCFFLRRSCDLPTSVYLVLLCSRLTFPNSKDASKNLEELLDDIWLYSGDCDVYFNWHEKMEFLASVYKTTESFMLQDESEGWPVWRA